MRVTPPSGLRPNSLNFSRLACNRCALMWRDCPLDAAACVSATHGNAAVSTAKPTQTAMVLDAFEKIEKIERGWSHCDIFIFISLSQPVPDDLRIGAEPTARETWKPKSCAA